MADTKRPGRSAPPGGRAFGRGARGGRAGLVWGVARVSRLAPTPAVPGCRLQAAPQLTTLHGKPGAMALVEVQLAGWKQPHPVEVQLSGQLAIDAAAMAADVLVGVTGTWQGNDQFRWVKASSSIAWALPGADPPLRGCRKDSPSCQLQLAPNKPWKSSSLFC